MKPAAFDYHAPEHLDELLALLDDDEREVRIIAGGQSLVPMMSFRLAVPEALADLRRVEALRSLRRTEDGRLAVGAGVRQAEMLRDPGVRRDWPLMAAGIRHIGHPQIRSRGTVCGSLVHHDPTAELPALAVALDARMTVGSASGRRVVDAADFFVSYYEVALEPGEMLLEASFAPLPDRAGWSFREISRTRGDFALVGATCVIEADADGRARSPRIVLFGVAEHPLRATVAEETLAGRAVDGRALSDVAALIADTVSPVDDIHASAEYRREAVADLVALAVAEAWERAGRA